ncbi:acyl-CoA dehydrogenase family protein [Muricoccus radiodurans]|uniref:acyl-CoA dehydrogenase family protein n=1 Tax=Muricoccus radiodurans TaxID=2231721 RepID=UPI003CEFF5AD
MDFELSDEQRLIQESLQRLLADRYGFEARRALAASPEGWSRELWSAYAELGILGLPFAEAEGGFGGGAVETMIVMQALGGALALEPYWTTVVVGGGFLRHGAGAELRAELAPRIAAGELLLAFAHVEPQSYYDLADLQTTARRDGDGWVLDGRKGVVIHGDSADRLIVTARTAGGPRDRKGVGIFLLDARGEGVARHGYPTMDGGRAAEILLTGARAEAVLGDPEDGLPLAERVVDEGIAALAAEAVGAMEAAQVLTLDYLKTRKQFGVPIGSFQAIQHRAADMMVQLEQTRSMAMYAAMMASEDDAAERRRAMNAVKVQVGRAARKLGQEAIQLHGGIGMTMEYAIGHYFARLTAIDLQFGDADRHLRQLSDAGGLIAAA